MRSQTTVTQWLTSKKNWAQPSWIRSTFLRCVKFHPHRHHQIIIMINNQSNIKITIMKTTLTHISAMHRGMWKHNDEPQLPRVEFRCFQRKKVNTFIIILQQHHQSSDDAMIKDNNINKLMCATKSYKLNSRNRR